MERSSSGKILKRGGKEKNRSRAQAVRKSGQRVVGIRSSLDDEAETGGIGRGIDEWATRRESLSDTVRNALDVRDGNLVWDGLGRSVIGRKPGE